MAIGALAELLNLYKGKVTAKKAGAREEGLRIDSFLRNWPKLCSKRLDRIEPKDLGVWRDSRIEGTGEDGGHTAIVMRRGKEVVATLKPVEPASVRRDVSWLKAAFMYAMGEPGLLAKSKNPFEDFEMPDDSPLRDRVWSWREIRAFVRNVGYRPGTAPKNKTQELGLALMIACRTGMRSKEILQIGKSAFLAGGSVLRVNHKMQYKNDGKPRDIPLFPSARRLFKPFQGVDKLFTMTAGYRDTRTRTVIERLMLEDLRFHDARATALTHMSKKVDVMTLAKISGHKSIKTLYERYYREKPADIAARLKG